MVYVIAGTILPDFVQAARREVGWVYFTLGRDNLVCLTLYFWGSAFQ